VRQGSAAVLIPSPSPRHSRLPLSRTAEVSVLRGSGSQPAASRAPLHGSRPDLDGQGAGWQELLGAFDAVRTKHAAMAAEEYNDDDAFKAGIHQARGGGVRGEVGWEGEGGIGGC
jgi:hypothetical protein